MRILPGIKGVFSTVLIAVTIFCITTPSTAGTVARTAYNHEKSEDFAVTHGIALGDVRDNSAVIWSRTDRQAIMHVIVQGEGGHTPIYKTTEVNAESDFTGKVYINGLRPDTKYSYRVWFSSDKQARTIPNKAVRGIFHTAPAAKENRPVSFAWGGDLAGQNVCRDINEGFPIFTIINGMDLDFFIGLGDMIYADGICNSIGRYGNLQVAGEFKPSANMSDYWAHWKYNREDEGYQALLSSVPYYAIWDDHEVVNDFGPLHDTRNTTPYTPGEHLLPLGLQAFLDYNPIKEDAEHPKRLYRTIRWGKYLEIFILDTRQYRDANSEADDEVLQKTMLGREQVVWLKEKLRLSDATWKIIVSSVPLSIPTGYPPENGRDGWANFDQDTGFEYELLDILRFMRDEGINNSVWITTDVHFASVFRYTPFVNSPGFKVYEFVTGPLNAGLFPNQDFDDSLATERLFFYGPESMSSVTSYEQAKPWMNFGAVYIDEEGIMTISINNSTDEKLFHQTFSPAQTD